MARSSFAKLAAVVLGLGLCAGHLLEVRQARLQAAHELARSRARIVELDNELWELRAGIGAEVTPERVEALAAGIGPMRPMPAGIELAPGPVRTASTDAEGRPGTLEGGQR